MPIGPLRILLKVVEVRRVIPVGDSVQDAQVEFQRFLNLVEDPPDHAASALPAVFLHFTIAEQVDVQFGTDEFQRLRQCESLLQRLGFNSASRSDRWPKTHGESDCYAWTRMAYRRT